MTKPYRKASHREILPRLISKWERCQALKEGDSSRCRHDAVAEVISHFDSSVHEARSWGIMYVCKSHLEVHERQKLEGES